MATGRSSKRRFRFTLRVVLVVVAILAGALAWKMNQVRREASAAHHVERLGGTAVYDTQSWSPSWLEPLVRAPVVAVDLSGCQVEAEDLQIVCRLRSLERLNLQGASIKSGELEPLGDLKRLDTLSLARIRVGNRDLTHLGRMKNLRVLSLRGTAVGEAGLKHLQGLKMLEHLDLSETAVSADGLGQLQPLQALSSLRIDDRCVTPQSVKQLQTLKELKSLMVFVPTGVGQDAYKHLTIWRARSVQIQALVDPYDRVLWDTKLPWSETTGGIALVLAAEGQLERRQLDLLCKALAVGDGDGHWSPARRPIYRTEESTEKQADEFGSFEIFLAELKQAQESRSEFYHFAWEHVTADHLPQILNAVQGLESDDVGRPLWSIGIGLSIQLGLDRPEVSQELKRWLHHANPAVRARTVNEVAIWVNPDEARLALTLLLNACEDPHVDVRSTAAYFLRSFTRAYPEFAAEVLAEVIPLIDDPDVAWYPRIIEVAVAANPELPPTASEELRSLINATDPRIEASAIEALGLIGQLDEEQAQAAVQPCLERVQDEQQQVRQAAAKALRHLFESPYNLAPQIIPPLLELFQSPDPAIQTSAAAALAELARSVSDRAMEQ